MHFAVIDVETTGIDVDTHRVIECAIVEFDAGGKELAAWSTLFATPGDTDLGAQHIHGISRAMTTDAPPFADRANEIITRLCGRVLVGHVIAFDIAHLAAEFTRIDVALPPLGTFGLCTREIVKARLPPSSRTLRSCCERLGVIYDGAHSALGDARATAAVFFALRERFGDLGAADAVKVSAEWAWPAVAPGGVGDWTRVDASQGLPSVR